MGIRDAMDAFCDGKIMRCRDLTFRSIIDRNKIIFFVGRLCL